MSDSEKPTLMVIDGHSLAFRAFYALPVDSFQNREGQHTNAIHGFIAMLINLLKNENPTHIAVAFDISRFSFRTRVNPDYKGTRAETPVEFKGQIPLLQEALKAMNITTLQKEDFEADDILATLATRGAAEGFHVYVVSGDRDTIQLVNDDVTLLYPNARGVSELKRYDRDAVMERYGIEPYQYPDIAALVGETSDNLIGIDKVGEKTAVKWVNLYGSLQDILDNADKITGVVGEKLREQKDRAIQNRQLNRLITDVELDVKLPDLERKPIDDAAVREVFDKLQFKTLLTRVFKEIGSGEAAAVELAPSTDVPPVKELIDEELAYWIDAKSAKGTKPLGLRVQTLDGEVIGLGLSAADDSAYVPYKQGTGDYVALAEWLAGPAPKYIQNGKHQLKSLRRSGLDLNGVAFDTSIAAWLIRPGSKAQDLAAQVYDFLGETLAQPDPNQLVPDTEAVSPATEAWYVLRIAEYLADKIEPGSRGVLDHIELPLVPVLATMELTGITVNRSTLTTLADELTASSADIAAKAFAEIGREINLGSPKQLQEVLFDQLGMPKTRANKTGYSTDAAALADLQEQAPHPFLGLLLEHRDATKLLQIIQTVDKTIDASGRVHTTYDQTGSATGRISSNDPNLQNIPVKTATGRRIRSAFEKGEGFETLLTADYSQIEMRIMAHLSGDEGLIEAFNNGEDLHRFVGARIFHVEPSEVTAAMRTKVKAMSYGLSYGLTAFGLSKQLRIEQSEAKELIADYFARFGAVRDYLRGVVVQAKEDGYTTTYFDRRRPFPDLASANRVLRENAERQALNSPIQGSAADIIKRAMLGVHADIAERGLGSNLLLQVHDELVLEVAPGELEEVSAIVSDRMAGAADLTVPLEVQVGTGDNWDEAAH